MADAVLTMRARPFSLARALSAGMASRQRRNMPRTLTPFTRSQNSSVISSTKARPLTPALLNRMSTAPNFSSAAATILFGASSPVISAANGAMALLPACTAVISDSGRSTASTCAPSSANSLAEAAPMPEAAPVTIAILPKSLPIAASSHRQDDLAGRLAREQRIHRLGALLQGKAHGDVRLELALVVPGEQLVEILARLDGFARAPSAIEDAAHVAALEQRQVGRQRGAAPRREAHHQQATIPGDAADRF